MHSATAYRPIGKRPQPNFIATRGVPSLSSIAGDIGKCGEFGPVTLTSDDAASSVQRSGSSGPQRIPIADQALIPTVQVRRRTGIVRRHLPRGVIVEGLHGGGSQVDTEVVPLASAIDRESPAVLISADGWDNDKVVPPVGNPGGGTVEIPAGRRRESGHGSNHEIPRGDRSCSSRRRRTRQSNSIRYSTRGAAMRRWAALDGARDDLTAGQRSSGHGAGGSIRLVVVVVIGASLAALAIHRRRRA